MSNDDHNTARAKYLDARKLVEGSPPPGSLGSAVTASMARGMALRAHNECPGEGRCHGCMAWCDVCGNVRRVCDVRLNCDEHHE